MLKTRLLSALFILPFLIAGCLIAPSLYFHIFMILLLMIMSIEGFGVFLSHEGNFERITYVFLTMAVAYLTYTDFAMVPVYGLVFIYLSFFLFRNLALDWEGTTKGRKTIKRNFENLSAILCMSLYIGIPVALWMRIRGFPQGAVWVVILFSISWGGDSGAYFTGKYLKRYIPYRLFPLVSPNKTWVGAVGSIAGSIVGVFIMNYFLKADISNSQLLFIIVVGNILSQIGDLFESFVKRAYKVKDSGALIPGHGGLLDKVDGIIFSTPFIFWYLQNILYG